MNKNTLIKYLASLEEEELRQEIEHLYSKISEVKHYYSLELGTDKDRERIYAKYKKEIAAKYKTKSYRKPRRPRIQKLMGILREVEKHRVFTFEIGEIFLYNVECATTFAKEYQFYSDPLHNMIINSYDKACMYIRDALMEDEFYDRLKQVITNMRSLPYVAIEMEQVYERHFD